MNKLKNDSFLLYGTGLNKNDIIEIGPYITHPNLPDPIKYIVTRVYKYTLFRRILEYLGIPFKNKFCVKVKELK